MGFWVRVRVLESTGSGFGVLGCASYAPGERERDHVNPMSDIPVSREVVQGLASPMPDSQQVGHSCNPDLS